MIGDVFFVVERQAGAATSESAALVRATEPVVAPISPQHRHANERAAKVLGVLLTSRAT